MSHTPGPWESLLLTIDEDQTLTFENPDDAPLVLASPDLLAMLKRLEWCDTGEHFHKCPICEGTFEPPGRTRGICISAMGHYEGCELAALLKKAEGK